MSYSQTKNLESFMQNERYCIVLSLNSMSVEPPFFLSFFHSLFWFLLSYCPFIPCQSNRHFISSLFIHYLSSVSFLSFFLSSFGFFLLFFLSFFLLFSFFVVNDFVNEVENKYPENNNKQQQRHTFASMSLLFFGNYLNFRFYLLFII